MKNTVINLICIASLLFSSNAVKSQVVKDTSTLSLLFMGDIMGHDSQIAAAYNSKSNTFDYSESFKYVKPLIEAADIAFANLEVTLNCAPFKGYPSFSSPKELAIEMKESGIDVVVTANNHACDRGRKGIDRTINILDSLNFQRTGTFHDSSDMKTHHPLLIEKNGFKFALINYTYGTNGLPVPQGKIVNKIDTKVIESDIIKAKSLKPDFIIAFMHWGLEYQTSANTDQKELAKKLHDSGVNIVIGSHPHVLQEMEHDTIKNTVTIYSLGNFISGQRTAPRDGSAMVSINLKRAPEGINITSTNYNLTYVHYPILEGKRHFMVIPVADIENNAITEIPGNNGWGRLNNFSMDARKILKKNINVHEIGFYQKDIK